MDLNQRKLTATEWNSIEVPTSSEEQWIGNLIQDGYNDVMIKRNETASLLQHLKVADSNDIDRFVFARYLQDDMKKYLNTQNQILLHLNQLTIQKNLLEKLT